VIRGLYGAATGMIALMDKQDVISNNLANVNTPGFKKDYASISSFPEMLVYASDRQSSSNTDYRSIGKMGFGVGIGQTGFVMSNGVLRNTGAPLDLALSGGGFFAVKTSGGEQYTRNGSFSKDAYGRLADSDGNLVLGEKGTISVNGKEVLIDNGGRVQVDGKYVDTLKVRSFPRNALTKVGANLFSASTGGVVSKDLSIRQGYLEASNVDSTGEMVDMVQTIRAYETNQRILKTQDEILGRAVNEVGRVS
jgi:flagellar basal-body rod protein FlgF